MYEKYFSKLKSFHLILWGVLLYGLILGLFLFMGINVPALQGVSLDPIFNATLQGAIFLLFLHMFKKYRISRDNVFGSKDLNNTEFFKWARLEILFLFVSLTFVALVANVWIRFIGVDDKFIGLLLENGESGLATFPPFWLILTSVILAPLAEETVFRGFLINKWGETMGVKKALVLSSALFALIHFQLFLPQFLAGLVFGIAYIKTKKLWVPILLHALNNALVISVLLLPASGEEVVIQPTEVLALLSDLKLILNVGTFLFLLSFPVAVYLLVKQFKKMPVETPYQWNINQNIESHR